MPDPETPPQSENENLRDDYDETPEFSRAGVKTGTWVGLGASGLSLLALVWSLFPIVTSNEVGTCVSFPLGMFLAFLSVSLQFKGFIRSPSSTILPNPSITVFLRLARILSVVVLTTNIVSWLAVTWWVITNFDI